MLKGLSIVGVSQELAVSQTGKYDVHCGGNSLTL